MTHYMWNHIFDLKKILKLWPLFSWASFKVIIIHLVAFKACETWNCFKNDVAIFPFEWTFWEKSRIILQQRQGNVHEKWLKMCFRHETFKIVAKKNHERFFLQLLRFRLTFVILVGKIKLLWRHFEIVFFLNIYIITVVCQSRKNFYCE